MLTLTESQRHGLFNCQNIKQLRTTIENYRDGICSFCDDNLPPDSLQWQPELGTPSWRVKMNDYPAKNTKIHILIVPKRHVLDPFDLYPFEHGELSEVYARLNEFFGRLLVGGGEVARFRNQRYSAGTVEHYHKNFMVPNLKGEVRTPLAKEADHESVTRREGRFDNLVRQLSEDLQQLIFANFPLYPSPEELQCF